MDNKLGKVILTRNRELRFVYCTISKHLFATWLPWSHLSFDVMMQLNSLMFNWCPSNNESNLFCFFKYNLKFKILHSPQLWVILNFIFTVFLLIIYSYFNSLNKLSKLIFLILCTDSQTKKSIIVTKWNGIVSINFIIVITFSSLMPCDE